MKIGKTKRFLAVAMVAIILFVGLIPSNAQAAGKVKLNTTKKTINVGDSCTIKILNNNKKVKWSVSNKNIKIVSRSNKQVKIKGIKKGTSYLRAKIGKKTYKCKVTIKERGERKTTQGIEYELQDTGEGVVAIFKNKNKYHVSMSAKIAYFRNGKIIDVVNNENFAFEKGANCALFFRAPYDSNYQDVEYDSYKISIQSKKARYLVCGASKIKVTSNFGVDNAYTYTWMD